MNEEQMKSILCAILDCGYRDLDILDGCEYKMDDVIEEVREVGDKLTINSLCWAMFQLGFRDMMQSIESRIDDLESENELSEEQQAELEALRQLDPREDIETFHNFIDTHVWVRNNKDEYEQYCKREFEDFESNTGFEIGL